MGNSLYVRSNFFVDHPVEEQLRVNRSDLVYREEVYPTVDEINNADVNVQGQPEQLHVFLRYYSPRDVKYPDHLVVSQHGHKWSDVSGAEVVLSKIKHLQLLVVLVYVFAKLAHLGFKFC